MNSRHAPDVLDELGLDPPPTAHVGTRIRRAPPTPLEPAGDESGRLTTLDSYARPPLPLEWADEMVWDPLHIQELVEDLFGARRMSVTYGDSNAGKTTLMLDLAFRMPTGRSWLGKRVEPGAVIYVAAESPNSVRLRKEAFVRRHGGPIGAFGMIPSSLNLLDPSADVDDLIELILRAQDRLKQEVRWTTIDVLARVMPGANENASEDMSRLVAASDRIREETFTHLNWVHHSGKVAANGARGHSSLRAACDTEIEVTWDASSKLHTLEVTKQRDIGSKGQKFDTRFVPIELGVNQWGKPVTACVVEMDEAPTGHIKAVMQAEDRRRAEAVVLAGFRRLVEQGVQPTDGNSSPDFLPKQLLAKGLGDGFLKPELEAAMNRLMTAGTFSRGVVGRYAGNRSSRMGLVLAGHPRA